MAIEDTFSGAKNAFALNMAYLNTVAQEIGMERAVALNANVSKEMGAARGKMMREQAGIEEFDAKAAHPMARKAIEEGFGISSELMEESPTKAVFKVGKCPVYEACQAVGMDAKAIEANCRASSIGLMDTMVKQLNPGLSYRLTRFRSGPDDFCEEEIVQG